MVEINKDHFCFIDVKIIFFLFTFMDADAFMSCAIQFQENTVQNN